MDRFAKGIAADVVGVLFVTTAVIGYSAFSPLGFSRKNAKGRMGRMNERRRIFWFAALYVAGLLAFLLVTMVIKASLKLLR